LFSLLRKAWGKTGFAFSLLRNLAGQKPCEATLGSAQHGARGKFAFGNIFLYLKAIIVFDNMKKAGKNLPSDERKRKLKSILYELKGKIQELEDLKAGLEEIDYEEMTPEKTRAMLEEIKVPPLELIEERHRKR